MVTVMATWFRNRYGRASKKQHDCEWETESERQTLMSKAVSRFRGVRPTKLRTKAEPK